MLNVPDSLTQPPVTGVGATITGAGVGITAGASDNLSTCPTLIVLEDKPFKDFSLATVTPVFLEIRYSVSPLATVYVFPCAGVETLVEAPELPSKRNLKAFHSAQLFALIEPGQFLRLAS